MPSTESYICCPTDKPAAKCPYDPTGDDFYVVGPYKSKAGVVVVSDIFGMQPNSKRFADMLAENGYLVVMPDFFGKRVWPVENWPVDPESQKWKDHIVWSRNMDNFKPRMDRAVEMLRQMGCAKVGAVGMCWGAVLPFILSGEGTIDAAATAHPAFFNASDVQLAKTGVLVLGGVDDGPLMEVGKAVKAHPIEPKVFRSFENIEHGFFGSRYDPDNYTEVQMKEALEARHLLLDFLQTTLH
ncbi:endo-1-like protein [Leptomonas pyrrhocoris]|uniref:Endo-1-like protein n=1 Tax=Leptomonas pyrrhocoris TaxID=157538 RepID=A0A0N0DWJ3_LEPPY|nr:endo-1-like protein [Leptomonas pyrrhocoris]KPA81852.1 endo-1-like protein [Leptomonas pyrrhocoris]|eukprot:XP_015660291.1 endo-1-like protein [Leptomonas pyrrhocoris]